MFLGKKFFETKHSLRDSIWVPLDIFLRTLLHFRQDVCSPCQYYDILAAKARRLRFIRMPGARNESFAIKAVRLPAGHPRSPRRTGCPLLGFHIIIIHKRTGIAYAIARSVSPCVKNWRWPRATELSASLMISSSTSSSLGPSKMSWTRSSSETRFGPYCTLASTLID